MNNIDEIKRAIRLIQCSCWVETSKIQARLLLSEAVTALHKAIEEAEKREWVELTNEELLDIVETHEVHGPFIRFARAIEAKLKEKNT